MSLIIRNEETTFLREIKKTQIIKVVYCLIILFRTLQILISYWYFQRGLILEEWLFSLIYLFFIIAMVFSNKWLIPFIIMLLQSKFDTYFGIDSIGTMPTFFINCYFVVFYLILSKTKKDKENNFLKFILKIKKIKYLFIILWCILNIYSAFDYLMESNWLHDNSLGVMLCNPFISSYFQSFRYLYLSNPHNYLFYSKLISFTFIGLQVLILPLFLIKSTRFIFYFWMLFYLITITFFIDTSFLAHFTWLLFYLWLPQFEIIKFKLYFENVGPKYNLSKNSLNKAFLILLTTVVFFRAPLIDTPLKKIFGLFLEVDSYKIIDRKLTMLGIDKKYFYNIYPNNIGFKWFVIYKRENNCWRQVPIMDTTGKKLDYHFDWLYTKNHGSDFLWIANTYQYAIGQEYSDYSNSVTPYKMKGNVYERLIRYDFNRYTNYSVVNYKVCFFSNSKVRKCRNPFQSYKDSTILFNCSKNDLIKSGDQISN